MLQDGMARGAAKDVNKPAIEMSEKARLPRARASLKSGKAAQVNAIHRLIYPHGITQDNKIATMSGVDAGFSLPVKLMLATLAPTKQAAICVSLMPDTVIPMLPYLSPAHSL